MVEVNAGEWIGKATTALSAYPVLFIQWNGPQGLPIHIRNHSFFEQALGAERRGTECCYNGQYQ